MIVKRARKNSLSENGIFPAPEKNLSIRNSKHAAIFQKLLFSISLPCTTERNISLD